MAKLKIHSPYTAAFTGCSFLMYEMNRMLPLFLADNSSELIKSEIAENNVLLVNSEASRKKYIAEMKRRFDAVPRSFWEMYLTWDEPAQRLGLLYVLLSTYRLLLDFHLNVAMKKWNSIDHHIDYYDVAGELSQIAANDEFVDSWSESTKKRVVSAYLTFLNQAGVYDKSAFVLLPAEGVADADYAYYVKAGQEWFLEACFLYSYEIERIKQESL